MLRVRPPRAPADAPEGGALLTQLRTRPQRLRHPCPHCRSGGSLGSSKTVVPLPSSRCLAKGNIILLRMHACRRCAHLWALSVFSPAQPPAGGRQWHTGRALLGAWGAVMCQVQKLGPGHQPLLPGRPRQPLWPLGGATLSERPRPGSRQDASCSSLRTGAQGRPHCPPG